MTDVVQVGIVAAVVAFIAAVILESTGRRRRLAAELAAAPQTPPSLYPRINSDACICTGACVTACPEQDVIAIVGGRPRLVRTSACVGHADCLRSCPVSAIELVLGSVDRAVEVPVVSGTFESTVPGLYVAGEITGIGLIHNALAQGRQAARAALDGAGHHDCEHDLVVIGAGPAGIGAALEAKHRGARCTVFEKTALGGAIQSYPRQKIVMSAPFDLPGMGKVKLRRTTKEALLELFDDLVHRAALAIVEHAEVTAIRPAGAGFTIETAAGTTTARRVVLAIGRRGTPRRLGVPGDAAPHVVYGVTDPAQHAGAAIVVAGGGDSAVEIALALAAQPETTVTLVHRGDDFGRCKPDNQAAIRTAQAAGQLTVLFGSKVRAVSAERLEIATPHGSRSVAASLVVCCLGAELPSSWLRGVGIELRELRGEPLH
ncbi:MAG TPA: NAD(P)-binding domain-containing protein [Kofleriaceae bacterium]|jgi:thioredoxin reductase|nr:NAD(P)-binding domain-containing protein [Kofleriaceae bacterium]